MKIRCVIIDDELLAREYIKNYIHKISQLELVADFNSPLKAVDLLKSGTIDLIFLDIHMPDISGIDFLKGLTHIPSVIFTTAYQEYALEGFNLNAVDYLLKPFPFERFFQAVNKVIGKETISPQENRNEALSIKLQSSRGVEYLTIRADRKFYKINYGDIIYIEGQKAYVTFHTMKRRITALASLKELEDMLPSEMFIRIHKSFIVSIHHINSLDGNIVEVNDVKLPVGRNYKNAVLDLFGIR
jgi:DNA-binding LytR/AlgR family response regulator